MAVTASRCITASIALSPHTSKRRPAMRRVRRTCLGQPVLFCYQIWLEAGVDISAWDALQLARLPCWTASGDYVSDLDRKFEPPFSSPFPKFRFNICKWKTFGLKAGRFSIIGTHIMLRDQHPRFFCCVDLYFGTYLIFELNCWELGGKCDHFLIVIIDFL